MESDDRWRGGRDGQTKQRNEESRNSWRGFFMASLFATDFGGVDGHFYLLLADDHSSHALLIQEKEGSLVNIAPFSRQKK